MGGNTSVRYHWTPQQKEMMKSLYTDGYSAKDIAQKLGGTDENIRHHLIRAGVKRRSGGMQTAIARAKSSGPNCHWWKGGRYITRCGYVMIMMKDHPQRDRYGYVAEHRYVLEQRLLQTNPKHPALKNGTLKRNWVSHHKNGVKSDNRPENLEPLSKRKHNCWLHYKEELARLQRLLEQNGISY